MNMDKQCLQEGDERGRDLKRCLVTRAFMVKGVCFALRVVEQLWNI